MEEKKKLRTEMHIKRVSIFGDKKLTYDLKICNTLEALITKINANVVHAYLPMGKEIDITPLIKNLLDKNITVVSPKTLKKRKLQNLVLNSLEEVEEGVFGTTHPANSNSFSILQ